MDGTDKKRIEIMVLEAVVKAAALRAKANDKYLAEVARTIIFNASAKAEPALTYEGEEQPIAHPARRPLNAKVKRVRFMVSEEKYAVARDRIRASGQSVTSVLEKGLERYARTNKY